MTIVIKAVVRSPNRLKRIQAITPSVCTGAGRADMGWKIFAVMVSNGLNQRSWIAERLLYQFISKEVVREVVR